jgi:hypothetical protein
MAATLSGLRLSKQSCPLHIHRGWYIVGTMYKMFRPPMAHIPNRWSVQGMLYKWSRLRQNMYLPDKCHMSQSNNPMTKGLMRLPRPMKKFPLESYRIGYFHQGIPPEQNPAPDLNNQY